jgi:signal transduction histidine kinase/DNA-binding response OmpR family regulator
MEARLPPAVNPAGQTPVDFLASVRGEAAQLVREFDWAATPLGARETWSPALRFVVTFLLANRFPMLLWWGADYIQIYNDSYAPVLGSKHPVQAMGRPFRECWHEVYDVLGPLVDVPFNGGPSSWTEDIELILRRHDYPEEAHFMFAYSPVPDETAPLGIGGVLCTVHENTDKIIAERRVKILSELGPRLGEAKTAADVARQAVEALVAHPKEVPFALVYLVDEAGGRLRRVAAAGLADADPGPEICALDDAAALPWPVADALRDETLQVSGDLAARMARVPPGPWPDAPDSVAAVPIRSGTTNRLTGVLVAGVSACLRPDALHRSFLELVGSQVAMAVTNALAYEHERRRAEALAEIDRAKTTFFSNVSHEFRTPITLMMGPLADALAAPELPATQRAPLEMAQRNAVRLLKLVNSLLDFARIEAGRMQASHEPVDLGVLTRDLCSTFESAMKRGGLRFDVDCEPLGQPVFVDRGMWEKVVLNLLSNAFKFTLEGAVRVRLARAGDEAVLEVADTGCGVPQDELPRLFERFHRIEGQPARTMEGSGIGLALVQELVRLHGGRIEAESRLGQGTTLRVHLPFGSAHLPTANVRPTTAEASPSGLGAHAWVEEAMRWDNGAAAALASPPPETNAAKLDARFAPTFGARVLVADDNADMRAYLGNLLRSSYAVETVADGRQALAAARRERPDLVLSDAMMPGLDGLGLLHALREDASLRDVPLILLSARAGEESRLEGLASGADDYIVKPFGARELLARVGSLLELTRLRRGNEERFRAYVQATSDAVYRMSADWTEMRHLHGRNFIAEQPDPTSTWMDKYIHPDDQPRVRAAVADAIRTRGVFELEHRVIRVDGSLGWTYSRAIPLLGDDGTISEWIGAASDVTDRHAIQDELARQQHELQDADRQKNEFLAMLAHELRNPLAPIRNAGELLARVLSDDAPARRALSTVDRQVTHLSRLVDDLLDVSRITQGRIELRRAPVRLDRIVTQAVEAIDPQFRAQRQRVALVSSREALAVDGDPERLVQCVGNVLANAAKYTPAGGEIRIETLHDGDAAVVRIQDDGVGIAPELLPRVFDLFVQGERTLDRSQGGLGIGLALVKRLVEMHGGSVRAESAGADQGSTFELRLPLRADGVLAPTAAPSVASAARRILVVDDNVDGADMLAGLLTLDGHAVHTVASGPRALESLDDFKPDIVLLDIGLPGLDGYEVARRIRADARRAGLRLVAVTGYGRDADRERSQAAGFDAHLVKPVEFATLQRVIAEMA